VYQPDAKQRVMFVGPSRCQHDGVNANAIPRNLTKISWPPSVLCQSGQEFSKRRTSMTRLTAFMFAAAMAVWGLASIPNQSISDKGSAAHQRVELARTAHRAFLTPLQKSATSASRALALAGMPPKISSVSE
jgi:hypothetical protein